MDGNLSLHQCIGNVGVLQTSEVKNHYIIYNFNFSTDPIYSERIHRILTVLH